MAVATYEPGRLTLAAGLVVALVVVVDSQVSGLLNAARAPMLRTGAGHPLPGLATLELAGHRSKRPVRVFAERLRASGAGHSTEEA